MYYVYCPCPCRYTETVNASPMSSAVMIKSYIYIHKLTVSKRFSFIFNNCIRNLKIPTYFLIYILGKYTCPENCFFFFF